MKNHFLIAISVLLISSCKYKDEWAVVNVNNEFTVEVPSWMEKTDDLKEGASFQYRNRFRNVYVIVSKEKQDSLPQNFGEYVSTNISILRNVLTNPVLTDSSDVIVNNLSGVKAELYGNMGEEKIFYTHYSLKADNGFSYQLCIWTRGEERKLKYTDDMNRVLNSFKLID